MFTAEAQGVCISVKYPQTKTYVLKNSVSLPLFLKLQSNLRRVQGEGEVDKGFKKSFAT